MESYQIWEETDPNNESGTGGRTLSTKMGCKDLANKGLLGNNPVLLKEFEASSHEEAFRVMDELYENEVQEETNFIAHANFTFFNDESTRKKLTVLNKWETIIDDARNPDLTTFAETLEQKLELGCSYQIIVEKIN